MNDKTQTIFRVVKDSDHPFAMINKRILENPNLSFKAKGILAYLLSKPNDWHTNVNDLVQRSTEGEHAIRSGIRELQAAGYLRYRQERNHCAIERWVMEVYEEPLAAAETGTVTVTETVTETEAITETITDTLTKTDTETVTNTEITPEIELLPENLQEENRPLNNTDLTKKEHGGAFAPARALHNHFPQDCQTTAGLMQQLFQIRPPQKPPHNKPGGEYALWVRGLRSLNELAQRYDTPIEQAMQLTWQRWNKDPFIVSHPAALLKTMSSCLAAAQSLPQPVFLPSALETSLQDYTPRSAA